MSSISSCISNDKLYSFISKVWEHTDFTIYHFNVMTKKYSYLDDVVARCREINKPPTHDEIKQGVQGNYISKIKEKELNFWINPVGNGFTVNIDDIDSIMNESGKCRDIIQRL